MKLIQICENRVDELQAPLSHYRKALNGKWNLPQDLEDYLVKNGYKNLGSGFFSSVYGRPGEKFVLKIGNNDTMSDCYREFIKFLENNKSPHLPKVGRIREYTRDGVLWYVIPIERLNTIFEPTNREDAHFVRAYWKCNKKFPDERFCDTVDQGKKKFPELYNVLEKIKHQYSDICGLDIDIKNTMLRGNTLVITDPLGGRIAQKNEQMEPLEELQAPLSHYRKTLSSKWQMPIELKKHLTDSGYELLGDGVFSDVYAKPGERFVIKVINRNTEDDCYIKYIFALQGQKNPHFPKIGKLRTYKDENDVLWYIVPIERLQPYSNSDFWEDPLCVFAYYFDKYFKRNNKKLKYNGPSYDDMKSRYPEFVDALEYIYSKFNGKCDMDLHSGNIMLRGNTVVLTDPLGFSS